MTAYSYWIRGEKYVDLARISIESVRKCDPDAAIHVWTDEPSATPRIEGTKWHVLESGRPAMVANLDAQIEALKYLPAGSNVLFLDVDTIVRRYFAWGAADMYVTWRSHINHRPELDEMCAMQPYNYGVVGAMVRANTLEAFYWIRARILAMNSRAQAWYGNQLALADLVGAPPKEGQADKEVRVRWTFADRGTPLVVRQLPCDIYNYTPEEIGEDVSKRVILHCKGDRKDLIEHYASQAA